MKKLQFSFECSEDPMQMEPTNNGKTRHCINCQRHIVDFTKMTPAQITAHLKNTAKPCGFMLPWQLDQVNDYLDEISPKKVNLISHLTKVAAIAGSPFIFGNTIAQTVNPSYSVEQTPQSEKPMANEILVKYANGQLLANEKFELFNGEEKIADLTSDLNGKIILEHSRFAQYPALSLKHDSGESCKIKIIPEAICFEWKLNTTGETKTKTKKIRFFFGLDYHLDFETGPLAFTTVEIEYYDSTNALVHKKTKVTSLKGNLKLKQENIEKADHLIFIVYTSAGTKTIFKATRDLFTEKVNQITFSVYSKKRRKEPARYTTGRLFI